LIDEELYVIQGENFFKDGIDIHLVRKGMFLAQDETQMEDILLTFCGLFAYDDDPDIPGTADEWLDDWIRFGGCEICYENYKKEINIHG
jgi:hypothetical protein